MTETDVLVIGAGPTGLALAAELRRLGVVPTIIDGQPVGANTSRAAVVHARTLEALEPLGVSRELIQVGVRVPVFRARSRDRALISIDFTRLPSVFQFTLMCPQDMTEAALRRCLEAQGGHVEQPSTLVGFHAQDQSVTAVLSDGGATKVVKARWVVGCDGMHSTVRTQSGIAFVGNEYEESFVLADVHMHWPLSRDEVSLFFSPEGLVVVAPLPHNRFRIVATLDKAPEVPSIGLMQAILNSRGPSVSPGRIRDIVWSSRFRIHHRGARCFRQGPILLCGDAAHVHSPAGGQGMNAGIQDGVSLAKVLAQTLRDGNANRLDDWAHARHEVARDVVALADRLTRIATMKSRPGQALRNTALGLIGRLPGVRSSLAKKLAELDA